jgi:GntR family transcriptional regulator
MALDFSISPGGAGPIFRQIVDQVRLAVATGRLVEGDQLPSVRQLAEQLVVNPNTVAKAYAELSRDGLVDSQPGRGLFVAKARQMYTKAERLRRIAPLLDAVVHEAVAVGLSPEELFDALQNRLAKLELSPRRQNS